MFFSKSLHLLLKKKKKKRRRKNLNHGEKGKQNSKIHSFPLHLSSCYYIIAMPQKQPPNNNK